MLYISKIWFWEVIGDYVFEDIQNITIDGYSLSQLPEVKGITYAKTTDGYALKIKGYAATSHGELIVHIKQKLKFNLDNMTVQLSEQQSKLVVQTENIRQENVVKAAGGELVI